MFPEDFSEWVERCFTDLPRAKDPAFVRLWRNGRLQFAGDAKPPDRLDELSARLVCATIHQGERLMIVLPDYQSRRSPLMFATGLIMHALDCMAASKSGGKVVYFGSTIGIRSYLSQTAIGNLVLDSVFPQEYTSARSASRTKSRHSRNLLVEHLPQVLCVYSPMDPVVILEQHPPEWLAIECGEEARLSWLPPLLEHAFNYRLPIVAWVHNHLSDSIEDFGRFGGRVFRWPHVRARSENHAPFSHQHVAGVLALNEVTEITQLYVDGPGLGLIVGPLQDAYRALARVSSRNLGRIGRDALCLGWRYLRALENLPVPLDLYEAEVRSVWGLRPITQLRDAFGRFINALQPLDAVLAAELEEAEEYLSSVMNQMRNQDPPLWTALTNLCVSHVPEGTMRLLVFPSAARKQLFSFALLARYNLTEDDLHSLRVGITSLADFRREFTTSLAGRLMPDLRVIPLLVGLPSPRLSARLEPVLRQGQVDVLVYPYQGIALARQVEQWNTALTANLIDNTGTLSCLARCEPPPVIPRLPAKVRLRTTTSVTISPKEMLQGVTRPIRETELWSPGDPVAEVTRLLEINDEDDFLTTRPYFLSDEPSQTINENEDAWVEQAIKVWFDGGWRASFALDERINLIVQGSGGDCIEERFVRSLRSGDRVLFIHGQQRQSLYELIVSRVHGHPAIELHLSLVQRWQEDFAVAYGQWRQHGVHNLDELLRQLRDHGSSLTSPQTLRQWLNGQILCPDDPEDLRRLAEVLDLRFIRQHYRRIDRAASRLRGLHRGLANRLNRWLRQQAAGLTTGSDADIIDVELGLTFGDFRSSLLILRVVTIESVPGPFIRSALGKLERERE